MLKLETIAIGDELLTGRISDTNSAFVAAELFRRGMRLDRSTVVADDEAQMREAFGQAADRADYVICFGGLGPTSDDKTAAVVAAVQGTSLVQEPASLVRLREFLTKRGRAETPQVLKQVQHPQGSGVLPNSVGLAPGFSVRFGRAQFFFLPGVPIEMKPMFLNHVLPILVAGQKAAGVPSLLSKTWKCIGIPESELQRHMDPVEAKLPKEAWLGYRTRFPENHLTLYWKSKDPQLPAFSQQAAEIESIVDKWIYTSQDKELEQLVVERLKAEGISLALAESCTGGLCAERITKIAGSSEVFWGSAVVYQNSAKKILLGVDLEKPEDAVSKDCSRRLAVNLKERSGCALALAITGYMGPAGGTPEDPVGTFYLCLAGDSIVEKRISQPGFGRDANQWGAATHALNLIREYLEK